MSIRSSGLPRWQWAKHSNYISCIGSLERASGESRARTYNNDTFALPEVETLIERSTDRALEDFPTLVGCRSSLVQSLLKALEMDSQWIPLYNTTGKLEAPPIQNHKPELEPVFSKTKKVPL